MTIEEWKQTQPRDWLDHAFFKREQALQPSALPPGWSNVDRFVWTDFAPVRVQKGGPGSGRYPKGSGQLYYHGTSNEIAAKILKEGLKPLSDMDRSSPVGKGFAATSEKVAISYAALASDDTVDTITVIVFKPEAAAYFKPAGKRAWGPVGSWPHAIGTEMSSTETVPPEMIQEVRTYKLADVLESLGPYKGKQYADWESTEGLPDPVSVVKKTDVFYMAIPMHTEGYATVLKGGPGSGNRGHVGRPGQVGGSGSGGVSLASRQAAFRGMFEQAFVNNPNTAMVSHYSVEEMAAGHMIPLLQNDGQTGVLIHDHGDGRIEATALFNVSKVKGAGKAILQEAIDKYGVNYVECYGPVLPEIYKTLGFVTREQYPFDRAQASPDWNYALHGTPDYHVMDLKKKE